MSSTVTEDLLHRNFSVGDKVNGFVISVRFHLQLSGFNRFNSTDYCCLVLNSTQKHLKYYEHLRIKCAIMKCMENKLAADFFSQRKEGLTLQQLF